MARMISASIVLKRAWNGPHTNGSASFVAVSNAGSAGRNNAHNPRIYAIGRQSGRRFGYEDASVAFDNRDHLSGWSRRCSFADYSIHMEYRARVRIGGPGCSSPARRSDLAHEGSP